MASFKEQSILTAAHESELMLMEKAPFKENGGKRGWYEKQNLWGGCCLKDYLQGIQRKPVKLTWFVFQK